MSGTVASLLEESFARHPDRYAVVRERAWLTYQEVDDRSRTFAAALRAAGVGAESLVAVLLPRSVEHVIALIGAIRAGAAFILLDPDLSVERLQFILGDCAPAVVIVKDEPGAAKRFQAHRTLTYVSAMGGHSAAPDHGMAASRRPKDLAYVVYTSGTTGTPKGVAIDDRALANQLQWIRDAFPTTALDRVLYKASPMFDVAVWESLGTLVSGSQLLIGAPGLEHDLDRLVRVIAEEAITVIDVTPSMLAQMVRHPWFEKCRRLRRVTCGGEKLTRSLVDAFHERCGAQLFNMYGPAEATITTCGGLCPRGDPRSFVPLGDPAPGTTIHLLDDRLEPVGGEAGGDAAGEICIAGVQVARGYLGRAALTAEMFVANPFESGGCLYRTGDLARRHADGALEYLGRADTQLKIRGHRIEVEEIESVLEQHPAIRAVVVSPRQQPSGEVILAAHLVRDDVHHLTLEELRGWLAGRLPAAMIPAAYFIVDQLPRITTGKLDRAAAALAGERLTAAGTAGRSRSEIESVLTSVWATLLNLDPEAVHGNFFDLGGNSLTAVALLVEVVGRFGVDLELRDLEANPTIERLARRIAEARRIGIPFLPQRTPTRSRQSPLSFEQRAALHLHRGPCQNLSLTIELGGPFTPEPARWALSELLRRHSVLRTSLARGRTDRLALPDEVEIDFTARDVSTLPPAERAEAIDRDVRARVLAPFDLHGAPLFRACLYSSGPREHLLQLVSHRLACDDVSLGILLRDFSRYYFHRVDECPLPEPVLFQYPDYARWQRKAYPRAMVDGYVRQWRRVLEDLPRALTLQGVAGRGAVSTFRRAGHPFVVSAQTTSALAALAERCGTETSDLFLSAFLVSLGRWSGSERPIVAFPTSGRRGRPEAEHVAGPFGRRVLLDVRLVPSVRFDAFAFYVRSRMLREFEGQAIPLDAFLDRLGVACDGARAPIAQIGFDMTVRRRRPDESAPLTLGKVCTEFFMDLDLMLAGTLHDEGADCQFKYDPDLFDRTRVAAMADEYVGVLEAIERHAGACDLHTLLR